MNQGLHLVVFCAVDYQHMLTDHLASVDKFVQDKILSRTVISNAKIDTDCNLVLDKDFWKLIDPDFVYKNVYKHNWVKQQILKLNLDKIFSGNILLSDVEVVYQKPMTWCHGNQYAQVKINRQPLCNSSDFIKTILDVTPECSFLTESMIFDTDILRDLRTFVENKFGTDQINAYRKIIYDDPTSMTPLHKIFMSEFELYNNFINLHHPERVWKQIDYNLGIYTSQSHCDIYTKNTGCQTQWINFYEQIKDSTWPECYKEEDFYNLPKHIQEECITVHGYQPKVKHGH
jgi:hypothetical protein